MKKLVLVLVAGISLASAKAQIQFGVKAGANFANITNFDGGKTQVGLNAGVLAKIPVAGALAIQPEVLYSGQGTQGDDGGTTAHEHLNYLNVPVLVKYTLPVGVFFQTGPQIGFLMSAKLKEGSNSVDIKNEAKSTDFSWDFGAGYVTPMNIGIEARYGLGLTKIGKEDGDNSKNTVFSVGLFYMFGGSSKK